MPEKANLLAAVRKGRNKNTFFSLSTALKIVQGKEDIEDIFVVSFCGDLPELPPGVLHKHFYKNTRYKQPFKLDSLLVSTSTGKVIDSINALEDIKVQRISTVYNPHPVLEKNPALIIRAASIKSETGFKFSSALLAAAKKIVPKLHNVSGKSVWRELSRLLKSPKPSEGIEWLRKIGALKIILPELDNCFGVEQNSKYHKYSVYEHCIYACDACVKYDSKVRFAALIHDIGKPATKGKNSNGTTFHKHEVVSTQLARKIVKRLEMNKVDSDFTVLLVSNHMYHYDRQWKTSTVIKFIQKVGLHKKYIGRMDKFPLFQIRHADRMGRGLNPITKKQLDFEDRLEKTLREEFSK